jgi:cupin fold WbuC family metalloprotein
MSSEYYEQSKEVLYSSEPVGFFDRTEMAKLKQLATKNTRQRIRLCAHQTTDDLLHEMLIVHNYGAYVRPHKHIGKSESIHIIEGLVDLIMFDDNGSVCKCLRLGDYKSGHSFYLRMASPTFHMLIIRSEMLLFHETTNGPFDRAQTVFAPWSPSDTDPTEVDHFISRVEAKIQLL